MDMPYEDRPSSRLTAQRCAMPAAIPWQRRPQGPAWRAQPSREIHGLAIYHMLRAAWLSAVCPLPHPFLGRLARIWSPSSASATCILQRSLIDSPAPLASASSSRRRISLVTSRSTTPHGRAEAIRTSIAACIVRARRNLRRFERRTRLTPGLTCRRLRSRSFAVRTLQTTGSFAYAIRVRNGSALTLTTEIPTRNCRLAAIDSSTCPTAPWHILAAQQPFTCYGLPMAPKWPYQ